MAFSRTDDTDEVLFFATPAKFRVWLRAHHETTTQQWIGFYRKASGRPSITWPESVDEALCVGWIDGVRKRIDEESYKIRFTPRRAVSTWSDVNIRRVGALTREGRMQAAGLAAFFRRREARSRIYAYENKEAASAGAELDRRFDAAPAAWEFFESQPLSYQRIARWWVTSAKRCDTRERRIAKLIRESAAGRRI
ncbi:MAG: YdeI/OmpD-associated family protein [Verrucomicrobiota bacterium]|nr:YdeI/OmpD-associated family protein [Verrucomicrobiota bacterium]